MAIEKNIQYKSVYLSLKMSGMEFKANAIIIDTDAWHFLKTMLTNPITFKFDPLFTHFKNDGLANFLPSNGPNRYVCHNETAINLVVKWNYLSGCIEDLLSKGGFIKDMYPMRQDSSVIASDAKPLIPQASHCDAHEANSYGHDSKKIPY